jgi:FkbM family methyltransferase
VKKLIRAGLRLCLKAYPLMSGCGAIANHRFLDPLMRGGGEMTTRIRGGARLRVNIGDYVGRTVYLMGDLDPKVTAVCKRVTRRGDTVLDIGANCGLVTVFAAGWVGAEGVVHAFEPQVHLAAMVEGSCGDNGYSHVSVHKVGLSDHAGRFKMRLVEGNLGTASLVEGVGNAEGAEVEVCRADEYLRGLGLSSIRLVKMDVEGHEASVLRGGVSFFREVRPEVIVFEVDTHSEELWTDSAAKILHDWGYELYAVLQTYFGLGLQPVGPGVVIQSTSHDFVALDPGTDLVDLKKRLGIGAG